ncbi:MAG TPA: hypothetical protein VLX89_00835 [Actinomycetota bacterium]|nr:hypothetical protein [Actinomycetota bacterium]
MAVEIFPFMLFGGIAVLALVGIVSFRPEQRTGDVERSTERQHRRMQTVRNGCWVVLVIGVLGAIVYIVFPQ